MIVTALFGASFVGMQAFEWTKLIVEEGVRIDGRGVADIRPLSSAVGVLLVVAIGLLAVGGAVHRTEGELVPAVFAMNVQLCTVIGSPALVLWRARTCQSGSQSATSRSARSQPAPLSSMRPSSRRTAKSRLTEGNDPVSVYFTHVRKSPTGTPFSLLQATVQA